MPARLILHWLIFVALTAAELAAWFLLANPAQGTVSPAGIILHGIATLIAALAGASLLHQASFSTRITMAGFFAIVAVILPIAGVVAVGAFAWIFSQPTGDGLRPQDKYVFGNPASLSARIESRSEPPTLLTLAEAMRSHDLVKLEEMIHGVKHLQPSRQALHFLRRFQTHPHSALQFAAQGAITAHLEELESKLKILTARSKENPADIEPYLSAAEVLLDLAEWTPSGDATADVYRQDALERLKIAMVQEPENPRNLLLQARCNLDLDKPEAALTCARKLRTAVGESDESKLIDIQALFLVGNWSAMPAAARELENPPAEFAEALSFWTDPRPKTAA